MYRLNISSSKSHLLESPKSEDDGSLVLRNDTDAEEDGDWEGEDDEYDGEDYEQNRATVRGGFIFLINGSGIVIHRNNLERRKNHT